MASRAITRLFLILALIIAAHAFKPISSRSVVEQLLSAAESLSFVLPDIAEVRLAQASYLANAFGQSSSERVEIDSRLTENEPRLAMPAVLAFGQPMDMIGRLPCDKPAAARRTHPSGYLNARSRPRMKPLIPELPEARPLLTAMTMTLPLTEVDLISMPPPGMKTRFIPSRAIFIPFRARPIALPKKLIKAPVCEPNIIVAAENEAELNQNEGPQEEFEDLSLVLGIWDLLVPIATVDQSDPAQSEPDPSARNCQVELPEMIMPPQSVYGLPKE